MKRASKLKTKANPYDVPQFTVLLKESLRHNGETVNGDVTTEDAKLSEKFSVDLNENEVTNLKKMSLL